MPLFQNAEFFTTVNHLKDLPHTQAEIAFVGRSNAGKSSAINALTNHVRLAYVSKTPGRTQHINFFQLRNGHYLAALPGYGYAAVPEQMKLQWQKSLAEYLQKRECLQGVVILMDIRHPLKDLDQQMIEWAVASDLPVLLLLTKADKLSQSARSQQVKMVREAILPFQGDVQVEAFSAQNKIGVDRLATKLDGWFAAVFSEK